MEFTIELKGLKGFALRRQVIKQGLRQFGMKGRKEAKRLAGKRKISKAGEVPGKKTGLYQRSVAFKVGSGGGYVKFYHKKPPAMKEFYPTFLHYGVRKLNKGVSVDAKDWRNRTRKFTSEGIGKMSKFTLKPRLSPVIKAGEKLGQSFSHEMAVALSKAIKKL